MQPTNNEIRNPHKILQVLNNSIHTIKDGSHSTIRQCLEKIEGTMITDERPCDNVTLGKTYIESKVNPNEGKNYIVFLAQGIQGLIYLKDGRASLGKDFYFGGSFHKLKKNYK